MSLYGFIILVHVIAAVSGLGTTYALPILMSKPKTVKQVEYAFIVYAGIEKLAKIGSMTLLITGLLLGILNTNLFTHIWYIVSIVLFIAVQPVVASVLPKKMAEQKKILANHTGEDLPDSYLQINKQMAPYNSFTHLAAVIIIILMVIKPF